MRFPYIDGVSRFIYTAKNKPKTNFTVGKT